VKVQHRGKTFDAIIMERNLTGEAPPMQASFCRRRQTEPKAKAGPERFGRRTCGAGGWKHVVAAERNLQSHSFRNDPVASVRLLTIMTRQAVTLNTKEMEAFGNREVFYYQEPS